jgi:alcohol dehydrogenase
MVEGSQSLVGPAGRARGDGIDTPRPITWHRVRALAFDAGCSQQCAGALAARRTRSVFLVTAPPLLDMAAPLIGGGSAMDVSAHLVPDAVYVDPLFAVTMPPSVTAATGIDASAIDRMSAAAMTVQRLLERNPRVVTEQDAKNIYRAAL